LAVKTSGTVPSVLIISRTCVPPVGGTDERVYHIANTLGKEVDMTVCSFGEGAPKSRFEFWSIRKTRAFPMIMEARRRVLASKRIFNILQCEVLSATEAFLAYLLIGGKFSRTVLVLHDQYFHMGFRSVFHHLPSYILMGVNLALYNKVIVPSDGLKRFFNRLYPPIFRRKFCIIPNGAPKINNVRNRELARKKYGLQDEYYTFAFFGKFDFEPNIQAANYLIKWYSGISQSFEMIAGKPLKFLIAGEGSKSLPTCDGVVTVGFVDDIFELLAAVDGCMLPHLPSFSGPDVKLLYCLAAGLPTITTLDGIKDMPGIMSKRHCLIFDINDPHSAGKLAATALVDPELRGRLTEEGLRYAERWTWNVACKLQLELYDGLVNARKN